MVSSLNWWLVGFTFQFDIDWFSLSGDCSATNPDAKNQHIRNVSIGSIKAHLVNNSIDLLNSSQISGRSWLHLKNRVVACNISSSSSSSSSGGGGGDGGGGVSNSTSSVDVTRFFLAVFFGWNLSYLFSLRVDLLRVRGDTPLRVHQPIITYPPLLPPLPPPGLHSTASSSLRMDG